MGCLDQQASARPLRKDPYRHLQPRRSASSLSQSVEVCGNAARIVPDNRETAIGT